MNRCAVGWVLSAALWETIDATTERQAAADALRKHYAGCETCRDEVSQALSESSPLPEHEPEEAAT